MLSRLQKIFLAKTQNYKILTINYQQQQQQQKKLISSQAINNGNSNQRRVVVTGLGAVTPLGNNVNDSWMKLINGECGITNLENTSEYEKLPCKVAAKIDKKSLELDKKFTKKELRSMSSATILALLATSEALLMAKLLKNNEIHDDLIKERIGVCVGMGMFDLSDVYNSYNTLLDGYNQLSPYFIPRILPNMAGGHISIKYGLQGPLHSVSTACATGAHAIGDGYRFIKYNDADIMICGSGESCIDPLAIAGFCRLRALSTQHNNEPKKSSRPFDKKRDGFVMGEGSAIIILEELEHAKKRNATIYAEILGYGLCGDSYHLTSPSPDGKGAFNVMKRCINDSNININDISYINAHATSTPAGDRIEANAISQILNNQNHHCLISSTKGAHGHLLGASGNLEALFVILACKHGIIPPSINCDNIDDEIQINIAKKAIKWNIENKNLLKRIALKNSFGFGGTNACLCIAEYI